MVLLIHYLIPQLTIYENLLLPFYSNKQKFDQSWDKHITEILIYFDIEKIKYAYNYPDKVSEIARNGHINVHLLD